MNYFCRSAAVLGVGIYFFLCGIHLAGQAVVGHVVTYRAESPHPYPGGSTKRPIVWRQRVISPGAEFVRIHFVGLALAQGDSLSVSAPDGTNSETITGRGPYENGEVWTFPVPGQEAIVSIRGGFSPGYGYRIEEVVHGLGANERTSAKPDLVCGSSPSWEDVECHTNAFLFDRQVEPSVAQLEFKKGQEDKVCTGWLVRSKGTKDTVLITANHCISTGKEVESLTATFNFQLIGCNGKNPERKAEYHGLHLLGTNSKLDYTLLTLKDDGRIGLKQWGVIIPLAAKPDQGGQIYIVHHPADTLGNPIFKKVSWFENLTTKKRCSIADVKSDYIEYNCDTRDGSSGAPVMDAGYDWAVALHSGAEGDTCPNKGYSMFDICSDKIGHGDQYLNCDEPNHTERERP